MTGRSLIGVVSIALAEVVAAGCALKTPPDTAALQQESRSANMTLPDTWVAAMPANAGATAIGWLQTFGDASLAAIVTEALAHNPDLRAAASRVEAADAAARAAGARLYPQLGGGVSAAGNSTGRIGEGIATGAVAALSWEIDLWGRVRAGRAAAQSQFASAEADLEYARQSIAAAVARTWFLATEAEVQVRLAEEAVKLYGDGLTLVEQRRTQGYASEYEIVSTRADVSRAEDALREVRTARAELRRSLEGLVGRYPLAQLAGAADLAEVPPPVPAGLPSELLARRPDVVAAERRVAVAFFRKEEAHAARFPRIGLTGAIGTASLDLGDAEDVSNPIWAFGVGLFQPLFDGGALRAQEDVRTAEQKTAIANYASVGARAFGDVENALSKEGFLRERRQFLAAAEQDATEAVRLARIRYDVGQSDLVTLLIQQGQLVASRKQLVRVRGELLTNRVSLHLALGGGF